MKLRWNIASALAARFPQFPFVRRLLPPRTGDGLEPSVYGFIIRYSWRANSKFEIKKFETRDSSAAEAF